MIKLKGVHKNFGNTVAVDHISFHVKQGESLILLGTSGCGKTTTLKMINRLINPTSGKIYIEGNNIEEQSAETLRRHIGYVIQNIGLFPHFTIRENIGVVPNLLKWDKDKIRERTAELMKKVGLPPEQFSESFPQELSGGQRQRVGLARALAANPPLILMDEPFGALDPITRKKVRDEFKNLDEFQNKTAIIVTHDIEEAFDLGDRICLMDEGKIQQAGHPKELLFNPANEFVRDFFQSQRLQLELQITRIKDLLPMINAVDSNENETSRYTENSSLLKVLEHSEAGNTVSISIEEGKKGTNTFYKEELLKAFYEYNHEKSIEK